MLPRTATLAVACISAQACFYDPTGATSDTSPNSTGGASTDSPGGVSTDSAGEVGTAPTSEAGTGSTAPMTSTSAATMATTGESTSTTGESLPDAATLTLSFSQVKRFDFSWTAASGADYYQLLERPDDDAEYGPIEGDIVGEAISLTMPLHARFGASYKLRACNGAGCKDSEAVDVVDSLAAAVGYFKASNTDAGDNFGGSIALSADGNTLAVSAWSEDSAATGTAGDPASNAAVDSGAVYVFVRASDDWSQQAYIKASNAEENDLFGVSIALSGDGDTLAVGAFVEGSTATGIAGDQTLNDAPSSGAVYVFVRTDSEWSQQAYVKASNTSSFDEFGTSVTLSADGDTLAVGAPGEDSAATGIDGIEGDNSAFSSGAVYVFVRASDEWSQQAYVKPSNTGEGDKFGGKVEVSADGGTLAVSAWSEDSAATGIDGDQDDNAALDSGAVYMFTRVDDEWSQQAYIKASNTGESDSFGFSIALSDAGDTLAVGAFREGSAATGIGGDHADNAAPAAGAVYIFVYTNNAWSQQAYVKASNTEQFDKFGTSVALSGDGDTLAVAAPGEDSAAIGIDGDQGDDGAVDSGAVYVFVRVSNAWSQGAYVKASNTGEGDQFGFEVAMSSDSNTLAVGAYWEDSAAVGVGGTQDQQADDDADYAGAVFSY